MKRLTKKELKKIRGQLLMKDQSFAQIAKEFYTSRQFVTLAIRGDRDSELAQLIREYVDDVIGGERDDSDQ